MNKALALQPLERRLKFFVGFQGGRDAGRAQPEFAVRKLGFSGGAHLRDSGSPALELGFPLGRTPPAPGIGNPERLNMGGRF